jgi:hypothetical protein
MTIFIQKVRKGGFDRSAVREILKDARIAKMSDADFTIDGRKIPFLSADCSAEEGELDGICERLASQGILAMRSGVVESTAIAGVFRKGHKLFGYGEAPSFLQTAIVDERCRIRFPFVTTRKDRAAKPVFEPLEMELPADMDGLERRVDSVRILEGSDERALVREVSSHLAIATAIYPRALIWRRSEIPPEIGALLEALETGDRLPIGKAPAYLVMTEEEIHYLNLHLYVGLLHERSGDHIKPMAQVIDPVIFAGSGARAPAAARGPRGELVRAAESVETVSDLDAVIRAARNLGARAFGPSVRRTVNVSREGDRVSIRLEGDRDEGSR